MNNQQFLFDKLDEECKEIGLICNKIKQFGLDSNNNGALPFTNREYLFKELNDFFGVLNMLNSEQNLGFVPNDSEISKKVEKVSHFRNISKTLNLVEK